MSREILLSLRRLLIGCLLFGVPLRVLCVISEQLSCVSCLRDIGPWMALPSRDCCTWGEPFEILKDTRHTTMPMKRIADVILIGVCYASICDLPLARGMLFTCAGCTAGCSVRDSCCKAQISHLQWRGTQQKPLTCQWTCLSSLRSSLELRACSFEHDK